MTLRFSEPNYGSFFVITFPGLTVKSTVPSVWITTSLPSLFLIS